MSVYHERKGVSKKKRNFKNTEISAILVSATSQILIFLEFSHEKHNWSLKIQNIFARDLIKVDCSHAIKVGIAERKKKAPDVLIKDISHVRYNGESVVNVVM